MNKRQEFGAWRFVNRWSRFVMLLALTEAGAVVLSAAAQSDNPSTAKPYATLDRQAVTYRGPIGATEKNAFGNSEVIGVMLPLQGLQRSEGETLLAAIQVAVEQEQARGPLPSGRKLTYVVRDESGPWGQASTEILKLIDQDHALVVLTSANGSIAHQAEQMANKISFPILTLASDPSTTETNVPWIFRLGPSDTDQARAFAQRIYTDLQLRKALLVAQTDHDGRVGRKEFEKATKELKASAPDLLELSPAVPKWETLESAIQAKAPDAVVVWTDAETAQEVLAAVRKTKPMTPVFLSTKAAQLGTERSNTGLCVTGLLDEQKIGETLTLVSVPTEVDEIRKDFERSYHAKTGTPPGIGALQAYEAIHWIAAGLRATGANRVLLRDYLANDGQFRGAAHALPFDPAGNNIEEFAIVTIVPPPDGPSTH